MTLLLHSGRQLTVGRARVLNPMHSLSNMIQGNVRLQFSCISVDLDFGGDLLHYIICKSCQISASFALKC